MTACRDRVCARSPADTGTFVDNRSSSLELRTSIVAIDDRGLTYACDRAVAVDLSAQRAHSTKRRPPQAISTAGGTAKRPCHLYAHAARQGPGVDDGGGTANENNRTRSAALAHEQHERRLSARDLPLRGRNTRATIIYRCHDRSPTDKSFRKNNCIYAIFFYRDVLSRKHNKQ